MFIFKLFILVLFRVTIEHIVKYGTCFKFLFRKNYVTEPCQGRDPVALESCKPLSQDYKILILFSLVNITFNILVSAKFVKNYPERLSKSSDHPYTCTFDTRSTTHNEKTSLNILTKHKFAHNPLSV